MDWFMDLVGAPSRHPGYPPPDPGTMLSTDLSPAGGNKRAVGLRKTGK